MKKILHISKYYYPFRGGTEQTAQDCVNALKGLYEQKVICFNNSSEDRVDIIDGIEITRVGVVCTIASQGLSLTYGKLLKRILDLFKPDIIIFHYPNPFVSMYLLKFIKDSTKLIVYWHLDIVKQKLIKNFFGIQNKKLVSRADRLIATSPNYVEGSKYLSSAKDKCVIIPSCINEKRFEGSAEVEERAAQIRENNKDKIICLAVGRHTKYKGFKYLIRAAHLLDDHFQIYITGKGEETQSLKSEAGCDSKIHFLGLLDDIDLKAYMVAMDIFCFPSITKNEAFGLALAEGMYYGKPAVTFTIPGSGVNYVCLDEENGIEVPNKDVEKYAEAIRKLGNNPMLRKSLGCKGKRRVEENFLSRQFENRIRSFIHDVLYRL